MSTKIMKTMDGNEAAAYISYAFTEVATIYPITPSSPMAEHVDSWSANGKKNLFGQTVRLLDVEFEEEMEYTIVGSAEADPMNGRISNESPVGMALLGHKEGDSVSIDTPDGEAIFKVLKIAK